MIRKTIILLLLSSFMLLVSCSLAESMGLGNDGVDGYDYRMEIWQNAAGNNGKSKLERMNINYHGSKLVSTVVFALSIVNSDYKDVERKIDTFTYLYEIKSGFEKETFDDTPYLIPYLTDGSDAAVIVIPGGGFGFKSIDGSTGEGADVAKSLNKSGWAMHPLPLLTAIGNGLGGGDYRGVNEEHIGMWAGDLIGVSSIAPENFEKNEVYFKEEW